MAQDTKPYKMHDLSFVHLSSAEGQSTREKWNRFNWSFFCSEITAVVSCYRLFSAAAQKLLISHLDRGLCSFLSDTVLLME